MQITRVTWQCKGRHIKSCSYIELGQPAVLYNFTCIEFATVFDQIWCELGAMFVSSFSKTIAIFQAIYLFFLSINMVKYSSFIKLSENI